MLLLATVSIFAQTTFDKVMTENNQKSLKINERLGYFKKRYGLKEHEMIQFFHQYRNISQTRELIEKSFKEYVRNCRLKKIKSTNYQGQQFLNEIQEHMKQIYRSTKMGELLPNGYPIIV